MTPTTRLRIHRSATGESTQAFADDVRRGLSAQPKNLPPKYFYDPLGSQLFEAICLLPEYYLTRAEDEILAVHSEEIIGSLDILPETLLELGSGSAAKTRRLIDALFRQGRSALRYVPVDISATALERSARELLGKYPTLRIEAYASDYDTALARWRTERDGSTLALFLGSNIGNFDRDEAGRFLRSVRHALRRGDALLVGIDLKKSRTLLEAAYDDALGVTAAFNLNLLVRINRELNADFDPRAFRHVAVYNQDRGRVELYLESARAQRVRIAALGLEVAFACGERIHTENSYKYDLDEISELARRNGFERRATWFDRQRFFSSNLLLAT